MISDRRVLRPCPTGLGELVWFVLVLGVVWALMEVFRHSRSY